MKTSTNPPGRARRFAVLRFNCRAVEVLIVALAEFLGDSTPIARASAMVRLVRRLPRASLSGLPGLIPAIALS
ncbi:hypothetical protein OG890_39025 [Streptomyces anulatus]|uniref:hypothetical protein n=1 Tax=Streptomyces anulatus TaxID=1892 RepID=UPI00224E3654|nr:hypothetical protein [Streptomyces anulatus]MCX4489883.1 hypothetical protein [Streptomyces anulatus]